MKGKVIKKLFERKKERLQRSPPFINGKKLPSDGNHAIHADLRSVYVPINEWMESLDKCPLRSGYELALHSHCSEVLKEVRSKNQKESTDSL